MGNNTRINKVHHTAMPSFIGSFHLCLSQNKTIYGMRHKVRTLEASMVKTFIACWGITYLVAIFIHII